ncbi:hypothetical protein pdam_00019642 [Pocillopora damicornis]|uniref:Uncharacterized protein n=1 Tax=Pocillopora damicornis TaxID=46731 RepID=A0A3M6T8E2_POCDA|nr:hypothetical protein pdam_00019642 [Pocillopora damicornis]
MTKRGVRVVYRSKNIDFQPRLFTVSVGGKRFPVTLFKRFVELRPLNMQWSDPFYLSIFE